MVKRGLQHDDQIPVLRKITNCRAIDGRLQHVLQGNCNRIIGHFATSPKQKGFMILT
jgi:hypothetical protein